MEALSRLANLVHLEYGILVSPIPSLFRRLKTVSSNLENLIDSDQTSWLDTRLVLNYINTKKTNRCAREWVLSMLANQRTEQGKEETKM